MAIKAEFPSGDTMSATLLAVTALGLVLAQVAPHVRAARDLQRAWNDAKTASLDVLTKFQRASSARDRVMEAVENINGLTPNDAVTRLRATRRVVEQTIQDFELAVLALDTFEVKIAALMRHRDLLGRVQPKFHAEAVPLLENVTQSSVGIRDLVEKLRDAGLLQQLDEMIDFAVSHATAYAVAKSAELAKARPGVTLDDAMRSLERIHMRMRASRSA